MAHQAHNIPWTLLAQNLSLRTHLACENNATDFHWRHKPAQSKELAHFVKAFVRNISDHAVTERRKFPPEYPSLKADDVVLDEETCRRIAPTLRHFRSIDGHNPDKKLLHVICPHRGEELSSKICKCDLSWDDRHLRAFMRKKKRNACYEFYRENGPAFFNLEVFKTLLMYGETDTLLKIYSQPGHSLSEWWEAQLCYDTDPCIGWDIVCQLALRSYIVLNLILTCPETWKDTAEDGRSYLHTKVYQNVVRRATWPRPDSDLVAFPHRQFFGIADDHFQTQWSYQTKGDPAKTKYIQSRYYPTGRISYHEMLQLGKPGPRMTTDHEIAEIRGIFRDKGLPVEISDMILHMAGMDGPSSRRLPVEHDPLHAQNREELGKYLTYCWTLMVRCEVVARVIGLDIMWEEMITETLVELFDCPSRRSYRKDPDTYRYYFV
ncbi:hypothetical protein LIA77_07848 [Sarocladium implicatum]|nr:hypothetical protein LIA77_07848 [Sarocladium implicatum]